MTTLKPVPKANVTSYLALNWVSSYDRPRALMVNPDAHYLELLAWCWGEVQSLLASADTCIAGASEMGTGDLSAIFVSRLGPLSEVMTLAIDAAMNERRDQKSINGVRAASHV